MSHPTEPTDLRTLAADTAWQHYGRRAGRVPAVSAEFGVPDWFQVTCDCGRVGALWRSRDGAERQHAAHLADEVRAALLPAHRRQVLGEVAEAVAELAGSLVCEWTKGEAVASIRDLAATGPGTEPATDPQLAEEGL